MRYILLVILILISFGTSAQAPPMNIGGPQGINVKRILTQDWMSVPVMNDTPIAPLTGSGWPGKGYLIFVTRPDTCIAGNNCPPKDTAIWEYTGARWKRVGFDYLTKLVFGATVTQNGSFARQHIVSSYGAFLNGDYYRQPSAVAVTADPKAADSTSRIDVIVITRSGPVIKKGQARVIPFKPTVAGDEIELSTIYFRAFDTVPRFIPSTATGVTNLFRVPGKDSIFFSIDTSTLAIKDSIGISVATNGLTASDKTIKLGGSLTENTNINLSTRRLNVLAGSDTTRFFANGSVSIGATPSDSTYRFNVNGGAKMDSLVVDSLYAKFGSYLGTGVPFAPIEFRATSGGKMRIDLRPSSNSGWNNNWYGAITHNGSETDIFSANYGSLYLGSSFWTASNGVYIGNTRNSPSMYIRNNNNVLIGDTANTGFRFDVNGIARVRDTLTLSTTPATSDTTANDLLVINSSNGQVRRYTGAWPVPMPTLQQVTTAGNTTTDSLNIRTSDGKFAVGIYGINFTAGEKSGEIRLRNTFDSTYSVVNELGFSRFHYPTGSAKQVRFQNIRNQYSQISFPDSTGTLTQRVTINGTTYNTDANGVIDMNGLWINGSATLDFPSTNNGNESDLTITVTGASDGDVVSLGIPNSVNLNHSCFTAWVSATNTVTVRFSNYGTGALNPASGTFKVKVFK